MPNFDLSDKDRLFLANQYEILAHLNPNENYARMAETLREGHKWLYDQYFDWISPVLSDDEAKHVIRILGIFGDLKASFLKLEDKAGVDENALNFPGFDGNNEYNLLSFADSLIKHGRFENTLGKVAQNSHMRTTDMYRRMIEKWIELGEPHYPYTKEQIVTILQERIHPENRAQK